MALVKVQKKAVVNEKEQAMADSQRPTIYQEVYWKYFAWRVTIRKVLTCPSRLLCPIRQPSYEPSSHQLLVQALRAA